MADTDKKFLDDDGVSQFAEETKKYVDNKVSQLDDVYIRNDDTTVVRLRNQNEINLQEDHNNAWFGYRDGKVTNWKFGDGTEGGLADVYANDYYLGDEKLSDTFIRVDDTTIVKLVNDNEINLQEDHNNAWFGYRGGKVTNWKFGDGTEGGLADVYVKDLYLGDQKLSDLLGDKANDADVVHKSGDETISGTKTFTSGVTLDDGKFYQAYATDYIKGGVPSAAMYQGVRFYDDRKNSTVENHITGAFEIMYSTEGYNKVYIGCRNYSGTSQLNYNVGLRVPNDSTKSIDFYPSVNNKINLGTSTNKWKTINGINPGALSLPGGSAITIDTSEWLLDGTRITYTPPTNGWLTINVRCSNSSHYVSVSQSGLYASCGYSADAMRITFPVKTGATVVINAVGDSWSNVRLVNCQGDA